ncbi:hypothetical protein SEMRO_756_G197680.1 [Seminavis robusta]|uniref:Uncharacterized protein n=1 Tax=Seminavis robusta TaxID=568900 RepID=A0A9N8E8Z7_9STRA|nr:hypothetical protein SEMRO_756_G197680.1 [Seminavis robusta]|eukprot:Sro756_g197680.1 n/a (164) ;mRNA; f:1192-1683
MVWKPIVVLRPVADMDKMGSPDKYPIVLWRLATDEEWEVKAIEVTLEQFESTPKYRMNVKGFRRVEEKTSEHQEEWTVAMTKRVRWSGPKCTTLKGKTSKSRLIGIDFFFSKEDIQNNDVIRLEVIVPKLADVDKGKVLYKAPIWASSVVTTELDYQEMMALL